MTLTERWSHSWLAKTVRSLGKGLAGAGLLAATSALTAGCLDRPVAPAVPNTTNVYIGQIRQTGVDKIDLLFMIDNSISMADKQEILAKAVPVLVSRLISPVCINATTGAAVGNGANGACPQGSAPEFKAVENIHIGIITSSLGHHGSKDVCSDTATNPMYDDRAELLPFIRPLANPALTSWNGQGFLVWDPRTGNNVDNPHIPPGITDATQFITAFSNQVTAAGELGCGYEASLEAWYRFLVDDEPVNQMDNDGAVSTRVGVNTAILEQRRAFMRRDSLLAIVMLTDENDCSINDEAGGQGWLVGYKGGPTVNTWRMPSSTASCADGANNACCRPCISGAPAGCPDNAAEGCAGGNDVRSPLNYLSNSNDSMNERCFNQIQRFGIDLLYSTDRYVAALTQPLVYSRPGGPGKPNPILAAGPNGEPGREPGLVFLAGITGVPWQDLATAETLNDPRALSYMTADQIQAAGRWSVLLGDRASGTPPTDPHMIESIDPRTTGATNPIVNVAIAAPTSTNRVNTINGHEQNVDPVRREDLQFACTFPLETPIPCTAANAAGCDCNADEYVKNSPLCNYPTANADGTQEYAKAYPGVRTLQVLRGFGSNSIVASICPKNIQPAQNMTETTDPNYGYNPAVAAIVNRLKEALTAKCLPRPLAPETTEGSPQFGKVPCAVVEVRPKGMGTCGVCDPTEGRNPLEGDKAKVIPAVREYLHNQGQCGLEGLDSCSNYCLCEINQFTEDDLTTCRTQVAAPGLNGYCYVDPASSAANGEPQEIIDGETALVATCPDTQKRILRFLGENLPARDGLAFIACIGAAATESVSVTPADM